VPTQRALRSFGLRVFLTHLTLNPPNFELANTHGPDLRSTLLSQPKVEIYFGTSAFESFKRSKHLFPPKCSVPGVTDRAPHVFPDQRSISVLCPASSDLQSTLLRVLSSGVPILRSNRSHATRPIPMDGSDELRRSGLREFSCFYSSIPPE
jgi:hypothetical protein